MLQCSQERIRWSLTWRTAVTVSVVCCAACSAAATSPSAGVHAAGGSPPATAAGTGTTAAGNGTTAAGSGGAPSAGAPPLGVTPGGASGGLAGGSSGPPADYTPADIGAWKLGDPLTDSSATTSTPSTNGCGNILLGVVRDFQADYENFETPFESHMGDDKGIVAIELGADKKPVYAQTGATKTLSGADAFNQFYRDVEGVNMAYELNLYFAQNGSLYSFKSAAYFPLDGMGFEAVDPGLGGFGAANNFSFTTEIHTQFKYRGGESFTFSGDDDVWVFVNNQLAIDLGGVHTPETGQIHLDTLGLSVGQTYPFDMFQAERHSEQSNFRADTDLDFVDCGTVVPK